MSPKRQFSLEKGKKEKMISREIGNRILHPISQSNNGTILQAKENVLEKNRNIFLFVIIVVSEKS
jgi:hypothetical protein